MQALTNPIELGSSVTDKTFILDIKVILNNQTIINLEMQVINQHNWAERSLSYLCRNFDNLQSGEAYQAVKFYATYQLLNVKNYSLATTWEELNMLAHNNEYMAEASATVHQLSQEERIRMECEAREDHYRTQLGIQHIMDSQIDQIKSQAVQIESQTAQIELQATEIESQTAQINALHEWMKMHGYDPAEVLNKIENNENTPI